MTLAIIRPAHPEQVWSKSKVKFFWDFKKELKKILEKLEISLSVEIWKEYVIDSIITGSNDIKLRIGDEEKWIYKLVHIIFRYHHDDEKYGNVHIEISTDELSKKTKTQFLWKFLVTKIKDIEKEVLKNTLYHIKAIY